jgi:hypothetical protein
MPKAFPAFRAARLASECLLIMAILAGCGGVTVVHPPDTSTADRPAAYTRATQGPGGLYYGTHFRYAMPAGWQNGPKPPSANVEVWMKQEPLSRPGPIIAVTAFNSPDHLPVEAYADVSFHKDLTRGSHAIGGITAVTVDGHPAQSYEISASAVAYHTIIVFRGGVAYVIQLAAPSSEFAAATKGPFRAFLASWRWD